MIKKLLFSLFALFFSVTANAAEMVNVEYIHQLIKKRWDVDLPYNPALTNPKVAANMKYLLTAVDRTNELLSGKQITDYGNGEYATMAAADTVATIDAVGRLVEDLAPKFFLTTVAITEPTTITISMGAAGKFLINWGDGTIDEIVRDNVTADTYSHEYAPGTCGNGNGTCTIGIGGHATWYQYTTAIKFADSCSNIASIDGSLGAIFDNNVKAGSPSFDGTFSGCSNLTSLPDNLFAGITYFYNMRGLFKDCSGLTTLPPTLFADMDDTAGTYKLAQIFDGCSSLREIPPGLFAGMHGRPGFGMFYRTFAGCSSLTTLPSDLFGRIQGAPAGETFLQTFQDCTSLKEVPKGLFDGIQGAPAKTMFASTFSGCSSLETIPDDLFAGLDGAPANNMFQRTFEKCSKLKSIPANLFGTKISGPAAGSMFHSAFYNCKSLTGPSARIGDKFLYEIWPDGDSPVCYFGDTGLDDFNQIPSNWKWWG